MTGFIVLGANVGHTQILENTAGATVTKGDLVKFNGSGEIIPATAGDAVEGVALETVASGATIHYIVGERLRVIGDHDNTGTTAAASDVGQRYDITGATANQVVDTSTEGATGQLEMVEFNPQGYGFDSDTSIGLFEIVERG